MKSRDYDESRRHFIQKTFLAGSLFPFLNSSVASATTTKHTNVAPLKVHIFSKHLQFLNYRDMADAAAEMGFDGVDLTVRPKGHVLPERVADDLPKAAEAIRSAGLSHALITTAVQDAKNTTDQDVLKTAAKTGVEFYRMNWFRYPQDKTIPEAVEEFQQTVKALGKLNKTLGIVGCYQNHSGNLAGASLWELWDIVEKADNEHMGVQYDIRHGVVEGGLSWKNGLRLIHPHVKILAIKDFIWKKQGETYRVENVPLGQGMIDFKTYFALLNEYNLNVPVSMHCEYSLGGAERGAKGIEVDKKVVFASMKKDLQWLRRVWKEVQEDR